MRATEDETPLWLLPHETPGQPGFFTMYCDWWQNTYHSFARSSSTCSGEWSTAHCCSYSCSTRGDSPHCSHPSTSYDSCQPGSLHWGSRSEGSLLYYDPTVGDSALLRVCRVRPDPSFAPPAAKLPRCLGVGLLFLPPCLRRTRPVHRFEVYIGPVQSAQGATFRVERETPPGNRRVAMSPLTIGPVRTCGKERGKQLLYVISCMLRVIPVSALLSLTGHTWQAALYPGTPWTRPAERALARATLVLHLATPMYVVHWQGFVYWRLLECRSEARC